jgi:ubiquinone/menaquinone biosynthesis C-methylase UbiE
MAEMFANAAAYERMMGRWSARLALQFLDFVSAPAGRILDVGCGTGSLVQALADRPGTSGVVGIDPAQPFIDYCRQRFAGSRFAFDCGNGMELPYPQHSFDHSLSLLVFMFIPQPEKAAAEMRRVTRPGGTVAACTWKAETVAADCGQPPYSGRKPRSSIPPRPHGRSGGDTAIVRDSFPRYGRRPDSPASRKLRWKCAWTMFPSMTIGRRSSEG